MVHIQWITTLKQLLAVGHSILTKFTNSKAGPCSLGIGHGLNILIPLQNPEFKKSQKPKH